MRNFQVALIALAIAVPGAVAAAPIANGQGWTGFYVGGHVGGVRPEYDGRFDPFSDSPQFFSDLDQWGFGGGAQIGYDVQAPGMGGVVIGVVVDATYATNDDSDIGGFNDEITAGVHWMGSARIRAGYPVADIMPYVTLGAAYADIDASVSVGGDPSTEIGSEEWGYVGGFGMDWAVAPNVTVGAEALFYKFNYDEDLSDTEGGIGGDSFEFNSMMNYRLTVNYRF